MLLSACANDTSIPSWLDSIRRVPIRTVQVDGQRIAYLDEGQGSPVILVHGLGGTLWNWEYQQAALSASHRVMTLDLIGSGYSDKPDIEYRPEQVVEFLRGFMDALEIQRASLVGNSMGAGVVSAMALAHPARVNRLVLIGGFPRGVREKLGDTFVKTAVESRAPIWLVELGNWFAGRGMTRTVLSEIVHDQTLLTPAVIERSYRNRKRPGLIPPLIRLTRNLELWEQGDALRLHEITHPTLILWGTEDRVFPPEVGRALHGLIAGSRFELIPEAGHMAQWERPEAVNAILLDFLRP